ncbi:Phage protein D [Actinobacillus lignieresii]|nr:Phage protein D [Actinobacillus lignieresii]
MMNNILNSNNHRTPALHLTVRQNPKKDGEEKDISALITNRFISLTLTDSSGFEADQLDLLLDDSDGLLALPSRGAILALGLGWKNQALTFKGEYTVDEVEHSGTPDKITIRARSADLRGSLMNRYERSFHQKTIGEIVQQIALENKLTAKVGKQFEQQIINHVDQTNESSISFLQRLAKEYDAIATVKNGTLLFIASGKGKTASGADIPPVHITRSEGDSHRFNIAEGENFKAVKAYWHDTNTGKRGKLFGMKTQA